MESCYKSSKKVFLPEEILSLINDILENEIIDDGNIFNFSDIDQWDSLSMAIFHSNFEELVNERIDFNKSILGLSFYIEFLKSSKI